MREFLTIKELAAYLRISYWTARRLVISGKIKAFKIGYMWVIPNEGLEKQLEELTTSSLQKNRRQDKEPY